MGFCAMMEVCNVIPVWVWVLHTFVISNGQRVVIVECPYNICSEVVPFRWIGALPAHSQRICLFPKKLKGKHHHDDES